MSVLIVFGGIVGIGLVFGFFLIFFDIADRAFWRWQSRRAHKTIDRGNP